MKSTTWLGFDRLVLVSVTCFGILRSVIFHISKRVGTIFKQSRARVTMRMWFITTTKRSIRHFHRLKINLIQCLIVKTCFISFLGQTFRFVSENSSKIQNIYPTNHKVNFQIGRQLIIVIIFSSHATDFGSLYVVFEDVPNWINISLSKTWLLRNASMIIRSIPNNALTRNSLNSAVWGR